MTPDTWWELACAAAVLTAYGLAWHWLGRPTRRERAILAALTEPPAPGRSGGRPPPDGPQPPRVPGHHHGRVIDDTRRYENGCWHMHDGRGRLIASNCPDAHRLAAIENELEDTP